MNRLQSFFVGLMSVGNLSGNWIDVAAPSASDAENIFSDWRAVGNDIAKACASFTL